MLSLFILNGLGYILISIILLTNSYLIITRVDILFKNNFNQTNYYFLKNLLNNFYNIFFNSLFLYIIYLNITNILVLSNLILLKSTSLFGIRVLKDLHKSNNNY